MKTMKLQTMGMQIRQRDYGVGDIIKRTCDSCFDQCGVLVGWDSWLRPLVFSIRRKPSVVHFQMVSLDEFEAGEGSEIVHPAHPDNLIPQAREGTSTDVIWVRIQQGPQGRGFAPPGELELRGDRTLCGHWRGVESIDRRSRWPDSRLIPTGCDEAVIR